MSHMPTVKIWITGFLIILRRVDKVLNGVSLCVTVIPEQKKLNRWTQTLTLIFWWLIFLKERHLLYLSFDFKSTSHWSYKVFLQSKVQLIMIYIQRIEINKTMVLIISLSKCIKASLQSSNSSLFFIKIRLSVLYMYIIRGKLEFTSDDILSTIILTEIPFVSPDKKTLLQIKVKWRRRVSSCTKA